MNILVVDDEPAALYVLQEELENVVPDARIYTCDNAAEALKTASRIPIEIAFLDIEMPELTGIQLAKKIKERAPECNIIFTTAYQEYTMEAFKLHASGYLLKPVTQKAIREELKNLRYGQKSEEKKGIYIHTFGQFDIEVNGERICFNRAKSKETLAFLVDRRGGGVTKKEIAAVIFEDSCYSRNVQDYLGKILKDMENTLKAVGIEDILVKKYNYYAVNEACFQCDLYDYLDGKEYAVNLFRGEYMNQYSWAEMTLAKLCFLN